MANFVGVRFFEFGGLGKWQWNHDDKSRVCEKEKKDQKGEREGEKKREKENCLEHKGRERKAAINRTISETSLCLVMDRFAPN